ncbi:beta-1,3-galactosyltransferase 1-like [Oculina patagonica]
MRRVSMKRVVLAFSLFVAATVFYMITPQQIKCSKLNQFLQSCASYLPVGEITENQVAQQPSRNASPLPSSADPPHREFLGWENPLSEPLLTEEERFVLILIMSAPYNKERRSAIRRTWLSTLTENPVALNQSNIRTMNDPVDSSNTLLIQYFFVCGHYPQDPRIESDVENETRVYEDILRLGYNETYTMLVHKTLTSLKFASTMNVKFVVKIDDDVYLDVPRMIWWLKTASLPEKLYAGHLLYRSRAIRRTRSKYYVGNQDYNETFFPVYCNGPFYILSKNAIIELLAASKNTRKFPLEDAYLGVLAKKVGIVPTQLRNNGALLLYRMEETVERNWEDDKLNKYFALGDSLTPARLFAFHKRYVNMTVSYL